MVLGDVGIDKYTYGEVERISPEAPVPVLNVSKEWLKLGMAANITHNLKTLGIQSTLFGVIGEDLHARAFYDLLEDEELKTWGMVNIEGRKTTYKERVLTGVQQICRVDYETKSPLSENEIKQMTSRIEDLHEGHCALILEDYAKGTLTPELLDWAIDFSKKHKIFVTVDPGRGVPAERYRGADLIKPNKKEAYMLLESLGYRDPNLAEMSKMLSEELEIENVVMTLGGQGMSLYQANAKDLPKSIFIPSVKTEVYDVSGAGDTVISLLTASLVSGANLLEASIIANCGGGVVVAKKGTATVDQIELGNYLERYFEEANF